jgi:hypothetical protein
LRKQSLLVPFVNKILRVGGILSLALVSFYLFGQNIPLETKSDDLTQKSKSKTNSVEAPSTNWEEELDKEIAEQESKEKSSQGSRGTTSPVQQRKPSESIRSKFDDGCLGCFGYSWCLG